MSPTQRITKVEWVFVLVATLLGLGLRFWHLDRLAVEHFDEGVYSSNLFFTERDNFRYPNQHLYAPPLVPGLIEWSMTFLGMEPWVPMIPGILLGAATVPLLWWMLRTLTGRATAIFGCFLLATNEYHIFYCRTALTEPVLGFFWVWALGLGSLAMARPLHLNPQRTYLKAVLAGLICGLCWWTKYNGWLTAFLLTLTAGLQWVLLERTSQRLKHNLILVGLILGTTILVYSPYISSLQAAGGYLAVSANHRQYFTGLPTWTLQFQRQFSNLAVFQTAITIAGIVVVISRTRRTILKNIPIASEEDSKPVRPSIWVQASLILFFFIYSLLLERTFIVWILPVLLLPSSLKGLMKNLSQADRQSSEWSDWMHYSVGTIMVLLWFLLMLILPPLYYPYPRLMLPFVIAFQIPFAFLMINSMMHSFNYSTEKLPPNQRTKLVVWALNLPSNPGATMLLAVTALILTISKFPTIDAVFEMPSLDGRTSLSVTTSNLVKTVIPNGDPNAPVIVYVYGEPAVYWHLSRQQVLAGPVSDLEFANSETRPAGVSLYLVTGPHAGQTPAFATQMEAKKDLFEEVGKFYYEPSLLIKMDEVGGDPKAKKIETLTLWKVK